MGDGSANVVAGDLPSGADCLDTTLISVLTSGVAAECGVGGGLVGGSAAVLKPAGGKQRRKRPLRGPPPAAVAPQLPMERLLPLQEGASASLARAWTVDTPFGRASVEPFAHPGIIALLRQRLAAAGAGLVPSVA